MSDEGDERRDRRRERGIFERHPGSGLWWVCYFDENGRKHREKVGPKGLALKVYQKRKNEIQERRFFPERIRRKDSLLSDAIKDYLARVKGGRLAGYADAKRQGELWKAALGSRTLREINAGDVERALAKRRAGELSTDGGWTKPRLRQR